MNEAIREVVSGHIEELSDPRIGFVTVTSVDTIRDLSHARVYVTVLGDERRRAEALEGLSSASGYLQAQLASELRMKRTATLEFLYDESTDRGLRVGSLLDEVAPDEGPPAESER